MEKVYPFRKVIVWATAFTLFQTTTSCGLFKDDDEPAPVVKGCMDTNSLNYKSNATQDDGSCIYSKATFYGKYTFYNGFPIVKVEVKVDGSSIGTLSAVYPGGVNICSAPGTVVYQFQNNRAVDWTSTITVSSGAIYYGTGRITPSQYNDCIKTSATP